MHVTENNTSIAASGQTAQPQQPNTVTAAVDPMPAPQPAAQAVPQAQPAPQPVPPVVNAIPLRDTEPFTREDEVRLAELHAKCQPLTQQEKDELVRLQQKYDSFIRAGQRALEQGLQQRNTAPPSAPAAAAAAAVGSALTTAFNASWFYGSLVATVVPGYFGRKLGFTTYDHWSWVSHHLILGALPVVSQVGSSGNHLAKLRAQCAERHVQIGLVVACITEEEMNGFGISPIRFAKAKDWKDQLGVSDYVHLPILDHGAEGARLDIVYGVVQHMEAVVGRGDAVYVHCKAGKGRSWMVMMCFILQHSQISFDDACVMVQAGRPQVSPSKPQIDFVLQYAARYAPQALSARARPAGPATATPPVPAQAPAAAPCDPQPATDI